MYQFHSGPGVDNSKMALGYRVRTNINPILSTFYCKCIINRFKFQASHISRENLQSPNGMLYENSVQAEASATFYQPFDQMILFRQNQAERSILVKLNSRRSLTELEKRFPHGEKIAHFLPFATVNDTTFVLVEFQSIQSAQLVKDSIYHVPMREVVHVQSPLAYLKDPVQVNLYKKEEQTIKNRLYPYSSFKDCASRHISQKLQTIRTVPDQMIALDSILSITDIDVRLRFYTAMQISYYVSKLFANISVIPFGSSVNGFGQSGCDLDLLCKVNTGTHVKQWKRLLSLGQHFSLDDRNSQIEFLELVSVIMKRCMPGIYNLKKIMEARVPIIKFFNAFTNMQCDLSSSNGIALNMSELLYMYSHLDWRVKPLVCTIRKWARATTVTRDTSGPWITNFSLTLLIIFYLQERKILPSLIEVNKFAGTHKGNVAVTNIQWFLKWKNSLELSNTENLHSLLYGFYEYYSVFNFNTQGICVREAQVKAKRDSSPLYIYNPLETTLNVGKNVHQVELNRVIDKFQTALQTLTEIDEKYAILKLLNIMPKDIQPTQMTTTLKPADYIVNNSNNKKDRERNGKVISDELLADSAVVNGTQRVIKL